MNSTAFKHVNLIDASISSVVRFAKDSMCLTVTARARMGSKRMREDGTEMEAGEETEEEEDFRSPGRSPARKK